MLGLPWFVIDSNATVSIFLNLEKDSIKGETTNTNHKGEIDVLSLNFGASNSSSALYPGTSTVNDIGIVKYTDRTTPELVRRLLTGDHLTEAKIAFVETIDGKEYPVVNFKLKDILVTSHVTGGNGGLDRLTESVGLNFREFAFETFSYSATGVEVAAPTATWDIATNTGSLGGTSNAAPTITSISPQATTEDSPLTIPFTVGDAETATGSLTLSKSTNNAFVAPLSGIVFGGSGSSRNVTITPAANAVGSATVTITVTDANGLTASRSFTFTVNAANDSPTIQAVPNQITAQNSPLTVGINVGDIDTAVTGVTLSAVSGNPALIPSGNITFSGSGAATLMTLTPVTGASGSALITLTANDGVANSSPVSFTLTVNPASATGPTDIQWQVSPLIAENSAVDMLVGTLITSDPNHGNGVITYTLINSAGGRFKLGALGSVLVNNGAPLDYETAATHTITVRATDPDLNTYDKMLSITVSNVNEAPQISSTPLGSVGEGGSMQLTELSIVDPDSGTLDIRVTFGIAHGLLHIDESGTLAGKVSGNDTHSVTVTASAPVIQAAIIGGGLIYSATGAAAGTYPLTIQANDLGNSGPGGAQSSSASYDLTVVPSPFNLWRLEYFAEQFDDPLTSGPLADADKDGLANLLEYGVGSSPTDPADGPGRVAFIEETVGGITYPAIRFRRLIGELDPALSIQAELATDQFNWRGEPTDTVEVRSTPFSETHTDVVIRSSLPVSAENRQMIRLRFTLTP